MQVGDLVQVTAHFPYAHWYAFKLNNIQIHYLLAEGYVKYSAATPKLSRSQYENQLGEVISISKKYKECFVHLFTLDVYVEFNRDYFIVL